MIHGRAFMAVLYGKGYWLEKFAGKHTSRSNLFLNSHKGHFMNNIVYIVSAFVIIIAILSFLSLR